MPVERPKLRLTKDQEFQMMKMILDKFALLGVLLMALGIALIAMSANMSLGFSVLGIGIVVLLIFVWVLVKEVHLLEHK